MGYDEFAQVLVSNTLVGGYQSMGFIDNNGADGVSAVNITGGAWTFMKIVDLSTVVGGDGFDIDSISVNQVPLPAAAWLFGSAILGLVTVARRKA